MKTLLAVIALIIFSFVLTFSLRSHGISSCRDRGGTPITRSWASESAWDVSCIEVPKR